MRASCFDCPFSDGRLKRSARIQSRVHEAQAAVLICLGPVFLAAADVCQVSIDLAFDLLKGIASLSLRVLIVRYSDAMSLSARAIYLGSSSRKSFSTLSIDVEPASG